MDYLTAILARLAGRQFPPRHGYEGETLRVVAIVLSFEGLLAEAFDQIRASAETNVAILLRMLSALETIASQTISRSHIGALDQQLQWIAEVVGRCIKSTHDRARLDKRLSQVSKMLETQSALNIN